MPLIVILDDRVTNRNILVRLAQSLDDDVTVRAFESPDKALAWVKDHIPDLVVTDYKMPGMDGDAFIRSFRTLPLCFDVPVVVVTVYEDKDFRYRALEAGATDFLLSPVDHHEFRTRARNLLTLRRQQEIIKRRAYTLERRLEISNRLHEQALRESEEKFRLVVNTVPAMITASDTAGRCVFANSVQGAFFGIDPEAAAGRSLEEAFGSGYGTRHRKLDARVVETGQALRGYEELVNDPAGQRRVLLTTKAPLRDAEGGIAAIVTVSIDISDRKAREREVHEKSALLHGTTEAMEQGLLAVGPDLRILASNRRAAELLDLEGEMLAPGQCCEAVLAILARRGDLGAGDPRTLAAAARGALRDQPSSVQEWVRPDGAILEMRRTSMAGGGAVVTFTDVTERRWAERDLRAAKEEAERASQAKSAFLSNMSHELRTPLNAIMGFSEIMAGEMFGSLGNDKYRDFSADILRSGGELLSLINDMLDLSRLETEEVVLEEREADLADLIAAAVRRSEKLAAEAGVTVSVSLPKDLPALNVDRRKVVQVVANVLSNAIRFSEAGGGVEVKARVRAGGIDLAVTDHGIGMTATDKTIALERFGRVENAHTRRYRGAGLGLPIAMELMALHGGGVDIDSAPGVGTTVSLRFPARCVLARADRA